MDVNIFRNTSLLRKGLLAEADVACMNLFLFAIVNINLYKIY